LHPAPRNSALGPRAALTAKTTDRNRQSIANFVTFPYHIMLFTTKYLQRKVKYLRKGQNIYRGKLMPVDFLQKQESRLPRRRFRQERVGTAPNESYQLLMDNSCDLRIVH
jgi:hypothetical protein